MKLTDIDLHGLGEFTDRKCGFAVRKYHLDEPWSYIYVTDKLLLKVDQRGPDYAQFTPPGGSVLFRRERFQANPSVLVWVKTGEGKAFTCFGGPTVGFDAFAEPDGFECAYDPASATYHVSRDSIASETEVFVLPDEAAVVLTCKITNTDASDREVELLPVVRPHLAAASLAPWDVPALYQTVEYVGNEAQLFTIELRSPAGIAEKRQYGFVLADIDSPDGAETSCSRFVGRGSFENPEALAIGLRDMEPRPTVSVQGVAAVSKKLTLAPGESYEFTMVIGSADVDCQSIPPTLDQLGRFRRYFDASAREQAKRKFAGSIENMLAKRSVCAPDEAFGRYINEFLPLQLGWVRALDRGWPTGMRGTRDCAQDTTALIPLDPAACRKTLLDIFAVQRSDGWFPRQFSVQGPTGTHDLRNYVDGGVWVWELLFDYLCHTKDTELLGAEAGYLDSTLRDSVLAHARRLIGYYLNNENIGEHGLCLIREGDWNDSVNRAGLEGRGESVMVSCQVVLMLRQAAYLFERLDGSDQESEFRAEADRLSSAILAHALNSEGYLSGVFNDDGKWIFSPCDPDGKRRVNVPVNAFGIISGVLAGENRDRVIEILAGMKRQDGWPLFYPGIGDPPIAKLGRIGQGDLLPGLGENGTPYNHGCHGFLGRAAAHARRGDLLIEVLRCMLPYDQDAHPIERSKTAPYAVVNHWKTLPSLEGHGGDPFLSGSISTALRNVYGGVFGIRPLLDGLAIDPCLPTEWREASVECSYLGSELHIDYRRTDVEKMRVTIDGEEITSTGEDWLGEKELIVIPDAAFAGSKSRTITCELPYSTT